MSKILLVIEEFSEQTQLEAALKKIGFDVVSISTEFSISQQILSFNPDIVFASGRGGKINSVNVGKRLKEMPRWPGVTVLGFQPGVKPATEDLIRIRMDYTMDSPLTQEQVIPLVAKISKQDEKSLWDKLKKQLNTEDVSPNKVRSSSFELKDQAIHVTGGGESKKSSAFDLKGSLRDSESVAEDSDFSLFAPPSLDQVQSELEQLSENGVISNKKEDLAALAGQRWSDSISKANEGFKARLAQARIENRNLVIKKESTVKRSDARKIQNELSKEWSSDEIKEQDKMRQEFTRALFKKDDESGS